MAFTAQRIHLRLRVLVAALAFVGALAVPARSLAQGNPIQVENAKPGTTAWELPGTAPDSLPTPSAAIQGYTSQVSVAPGEVLQLHVSTSPAAPYRVEIYRLGWYGGAGGRLVACLPASCASSESGVDQPIPSPDPHTGELDAGWPVTDSITVGSDWTSGYYVAKLVVTSAQQGSWVPFIVRGATGTHSAILVQAAVNTWAAYDDWGGPAHLGKSLYGFNSTTAPVADSPNNAAVMVSFNRPFGGDQNAWPFAWEYNLVRYLERNGYDVSYQTDVDTDQNPASLLGHRLDITNGHDEYWSRAMRDAWEAARAAGVNLAFMGGNVAYWQARYGDADRTLIEYRDAGHDPEKIPSLRTEPFRSADVNRPECRLLGVGLVGGAAAGDPVRSYYVPSAALSNPWFKGTGFAAGETLNDTVGYEWGALQPGCALPGPTTPLLQFDSNSPAQAVTYTDAASGSRVFSSSSMQANWALDDFGHSPHADAHAQILFANIFNDLGAIPVPVLAAPIPGTSAVTLSWSSSMGLSSFRVNVDGKPVGRLSASACANGACRLSVHIAAGAHAWSVIATDLDGATATSESLPFAVAVLRSPRSASVLWSPTPRLSWERFRGANGAPRYQVLLDGRLVASTRSTSYRPRRALADGRHVWSIVVWDRTGRRAASPEEAFLIRSVRVSPQPRRRVLASGVLLHVFCPSRCSITVRLRGSVVKRRASGGIAEITVGLSAPLRRHLASARRALVRLTVTTRVGRRMRTVRLMVRWTPAGTRSG